MDGLEVLFYPSWYPKAEQIAADLRASGLCFPVMHTEKSIGPALGNADAKERAQGLQRLEANCQFARQLGVKLAVLHLWGLPDSDHYMERNLAMLDACLTVAANAGIHLAVETIPCERADPLSNARLALEQDKRCLIALDTEFLAVHQQLEASLASAWLWQGPSVQHVHIKDYDGQMVDQIGRRRYLHPGEGKIDFARFFRGLAQQGFNGSISLESSGVQPDRSIDISRVQKSLLFLRSLMEQASGE